jgi:hypothetical protein
MLIAHVEQEGVWLVEGGMQNLARALEALARENGVTFRHGAEVKALTLSSGRICGATLSTDETLAAEHIVLNADAAALAKGEFGPAGPNARAATVYVGRDLHDERQNAGLSAQPSQRFLLARLRNRVCRHLPARALAGLADNLCLRPGPGRYVSVLQRTRAADGAGQRPRDGRPSSIRLFRG